MNRFKSISKLVILLAVVACTCVMAQDIAQLPTATAMAHVVKKVPPEYPVAARQLNVSGQQEVSIVVSAQGNVEEAKVTKGNAIFTVTSVNAAKQWKFQPLLKDGQPVRFSTVLIFSYSK
jgi:TonB family protein